MQAYSFTELIEGNAIAGVKNIVIPKIQRDYAQGRKTSRATDVRNSFTASLLATLESETADIQMLDFIYGYSNDGNFEPLDGQQRLTTLFLLHWLVLPDDRRGVLVLEDKEAVLSYRTRPSARDFCKFLVNIDIKSLRADFDAAVEKARNEKKPLPELSQFITRLDEFRHTWSLDPTVQSMLRMLNTMMQSLDSFAHIAELDVDKLNNIRFHIRKIDDLRQGDELYVKMNARGLELSDFDNTKSALEGDMLQHNIPAVVQAAWRAGIDGAWIDYFWHRAGADTPGRELNLDDIHKIEDDLKTFILRLGILHWFVDNFGALPDPTINPYPAQILAMTETSSTVRSKLSANFITYLGLRFKDIHSANPGRCPVFGFGAVVRDMEGLLYNADGKWLAADSLAPDVKRNSENDMSFMDAFLENDFSYANILILYGMLAFTHVFPASQIARNQKLKQDWSTWLRMIRNLSLRRNSNTPFDASNEVYDAIRGIDSFIKAFETSVNNDATVTMSAFIQATPAINGFDKTIYEEEQIKEKLRADSQWVSTLNGFENTGYLFGQLRAPLQWAANDMSLFKKYAKTLNAFMTDDFNGELFYCALLLTSSLQADHYPFNNSLLTFDNHRDRSFKRYLREQVNQVYAPALRRLADIRINEFEPTTSTGDFLNAVIARYSSDTRIPLWKRQLAQYHNIISERSYRKLIMPHDNAYLIESIRADKCWNINLCYLKKTRYSDPYFVLHNTKEPVNPDTITGGKLIVATGKDGILPLSGLTSKSRYRTPLKGLKRKKHP